MISTLPHPPTKSPNDTFVWMDWFNLVRKFAYPAFAQVYDTTTQTPVAPNTAYAITYNNMSFGRGIKIGTPTSRLYVPNSGIYDIHFSLEFESTTAAVKDIWIWFRKNGVDIPYSASHLNISGVAADAIPAWNYYIEMTAGDYVELMYATSDINVKIESYAAAGPVPAIPAVIVTIKQISP